MSDFDWQTALHLEHVRAERAEARLAEAEAFIQALSKELWPRVKRMTRGDSHAVVTLDSARAFLSESRSRPWNDGGSEGWGYE